MSPFIIYSDLEISLLPTSFRRHIKHVLPYTHLIDEETEVKWRKGFVLGHTGRQRLLLGLLTQIFF